MRDSQTDRKIHLKRQLGEMMRSWSKENADYLWRQAELAAIRAELTLLRAGMPAAPTLLRKANFNPNQPRIPKDNPGGGQWTSDGGIQVTTSDGFLTGISQIDDISRTLSDTLISVMEKLQFIPKSSPQVYGILVHSAFATSVRLQNLPGIGYRNVERTFSLDDSDPRYGLAGSIRTDVTLQNVQGDILAIYDVKTGDRRMSRTRANELREKSGASANTPVFELNIERGIIRKSARSTALRQFELASCRHRTGD